jgi:hypothetical protein
MRSAFVLGLLVLALALPSAAQANRAYGAFNPFSDLITFQLSNDGREIKALALRMELDCGDGFVFLWAANYRLARRAPSAGVRDRNTLVAERGTPKGRLTARWGEDLTFTGKVAVTRVKAGSARLRLTLATTLDGDRCATTLNLRAQRKPGTLFVGVTDDDEPVWVRKQGNSVEWLSGYGVACSPKGFMEGIHTNALGMEADGSFGWPELLDGFQYSPGGATPFDQSVQISGTLDDNRASGVLQIMGTGGPDDAESCDTGKRKWTALST